MMADGSKALKDDDARLVAISAHRRSILVEAGAGSGKTAVMAGRIAMMLAEGVAPRNIAAVTFTELAASELLYRVREFVTDLLAGEVARELRIALPAGLSGAQRAHLAQAATAIDEITCSTIHGFCQRLIKPYPAEADIDPGAAIIDRTQGDLAFLEIVDAWLRERLSEDRGGLIAELVLHNAAPTVALIHRIAQSLRRRRGLLAPPASDVGALAANFLRTVDTFVAFQRVTAASEPETEVLVGRFRELVNVLASANLATPAGLVNLLVTRPSADLVTQKGTFRSYKKKGKWADAAKRVGLSKADGERLNNETTEHYEACGVAWTALQQAAASRALAVLIDDTKPILERYRDYKRGSAQLDFDDLIFAARDLLRDHDAVRRALGERFRHVLVDEFQDTDPLQTEIFWRLCGDPPAPDAHWSQFCMRPGSLFLVGDPKQAIYRFRGADVIAYVEARTAFREQDGESLLAISTNFRSRTSILTFVNERFEALLSADGQPGFTALDAFHDDPAEGVCVVALDVKVADEQGEATAERQRDAEAESVSELCACLIGHRKVVDRRSGQQRTCQPGDIALLAPTGKDLWRYEEALERRGIPVATQAGKGLFRRQEIQDLIALTRVLADRRDTLALGALLRGPLVGLTEEELLDIVWAMPRSEDAPERIPRLDLSVAAALVTNQLAADVLVKLQSLYKRSNSTTPHELLSQAVDTLRVRPILLARHRGQAERALANVDLYLSLATGYAVRGLQAFAEAMTAAWTDEERAVEGRPDAQEESVALFTMHAAKGLEWPVVIPINTMTGVFGPDSAVVDRSTDTFFCPILGIAPEGHEAAFEAEKAELDRERVRLWYVAATRARELLVLPRSDVPSSKSAWNTLIDLNLPGLPAIDPAQLPPATLGKPVASPNAQTRVTFAEEAAAIAGRQKRLVWHAPSRHEGETGDVAAVEEADIWSDSADEPTPHLRTPAAVQGGLERGLILHKLMEEILSGEIHDDPAAVMARAVELIRSLGRTPVADPATGLAAAELAGCVVRTLVLPQVAALRPGLMAEFPVYGIQAEGDGESAIAGVADALTLSATGVPDVVVDWKSDVNPSAATLDHYRAQVRVYLDITGARGGLIVLMTTGIVLEVVPSSSRAPST
jgi:ATP-dependent exoDNAse (exonuclease V) beta subunit